MGRNGLAVTDTISGGIGDKGAEGHNVRHERGIKQDRREEYSGVQSDSE